jgi:hypothetical protein
MDPLHLCLGTSTHIDTSKKGDTMITYEDAIRLIQDSFDSLHRSGMIEEKEKIDYDTCLLGDGSVLDSIGFVTLFAEIEDRIFQKVEKEIYLVLDEISEFDINAPFLSAKIIANYMTNKVNQE